MHVLFSLFMLAALGYAVYAALGISAVTDKYNNTKRTLNVRPLKAIPGAALFALFMLLNLSYTEIY